MAADCGAETMHKAMQKVGPAKVAALVTDNPSNMAKARQLLTTLPGCEHIITLRYGRCGSLEPYTAAGD